MERHFDDVLDRSWTATLEADDAELGDWDLVFTSDEDEVRHVPVYGPMDEALEELGDDDLQTALEAAGAFTGLLLVDEELRLWWVRDPEEDPTADGTWAVKFYGGDDQHTHPGPLPHRLGDLSEDELMELLDEARGRVLEPMDVASEND